MNVKATAVAVALLAAAAAVQAEVANIDMDFYEQINVFADKGYYRTSIYRGMVSGSVERVTIFDSGTGGADPGVFTGMDVDFVLFDQDGDLDTGEDQILPSLDPDRTFVTPGSVTTPAGHFGPTPNRPGDLFGLNGANQLDNSIATLTRRDAWYPFAVNGDVVRNSRGWVSLGRNGQLTLEFDGVQGDWFLFVGEVGLQNEPVFDPQAELGEVIIELGELAVAEKTLFSPEDGDVVEYDLGNEDVISHYEWKIGEAGQWQADPLGQTGGTEGPPPDIRELWINYYQLAQMYPDKVNTVLIGEYDPEDPTLQTLPIFVRIHDIQGGVHDRQAASVTLVNQVIPEPASLVLLGLGALALRRRRR
jgi:hypothetical protein